MIEIFRKFYRAIASRIFIFLPIDNNKILFCSFFGNGYSGNPKYISNNLLERKKNGEIDVEVIWLLKNTKDKVPDGIKVVKYGSLRSYMEYATAKVLVQDVRNAHLCKKRKGQVYLQTWHGPRTLKCVEKQSVVPLSKGYIKSAKYDGLVTDAVVADSKEQIKSFSKYFWMNKDVEYLSYGLPRNDILLNRKDDLALMKNIRKKIGCGKDDYLIFYAPTFRDDGDVKAYLSRYKDIIKAFEKNTNRQCKIIVRFHPNVNLSEIDIDFNENVINANTYPDIQDLILCCDCLISDYSSIIADFILINKPVYLYVCDFDKYRSTRGVTEQYMDLPMKRCLSEDELVSEIEKFDLQRYNREIQKFSKKYPLFDDGSASQHIADWILEKNKIR